MRGTVSLSAGYCWHRLSSINTRLMVWISRPWAWNIGRSQILSSEQTMSLKQRKVPNTVFRVHGWVRTTHHNSHGSKQDLLRMLGPHSSVPCNISPAIFLGPLISVVQVVLLLNLMGSRWSWISVVQIVLLLNYSQWTSSLSCSCWKPETEVGIPGRPT